VISSKKGITNEYRIVKNGIFVVTWSLKRVIYCLVKSRGEKTGRDEKWKDE
jgi:hypothetical protein